jgi:hypothetical protein
MSCPTGNGRAGFSRHMNERQALASLPERD